MSDVNTNLNSVAQGENLLEVKNLKKYFVVDKDLLGRPTAYLKAVDNVSFTLKKGKTLGIVGESGCGKTTMGRTILRLYDVTGGEVNFKGTLVNDSAGLRLASFKDCNLVGTGNVVANYNVNSAVADLVKSMLK